MPLPTGITRVSVADDESQASRADDDRVVSLAPSLSAEGRYVVFASDADNLVPNDTNDARDVFVRDVVAGTTTRVSLADDGGEAGGADSFSGGISADGGRVAFASAADNLAPGDVDGAPDVFVRDLTAGTTTQVSVDAFESTRPDFVGFSGSAAISADGRFVAFTSDADNLAPGDTSANDVFLRDLDNGTTTLVSVGAGGTGGSNPDPTRFSAPVISADGRFIAFSSNDAFLVPGDTNETGDVFVRDVVAGTTTRVSVADDGAEASFPFDPIGTPAISADGRFVAFESNAALVPGDTNDASDIFVRDLVAGTTTRVSVGIDGGQGAFGSSDPSISADGRYVTFDSSSDNLVAGDNDGNEGDVFVRDLAAGTTTLVAVDPDGGQRFSSDNASLSADGRYVTFTGTANLVPGATDDDRIDVFTVPLPGATPPAGDTTVVAELRVRSASFTDVFGWYDAATGEGQILDARALADADPATVDQTYRFALDADRVDDLEFFIVPDGAFYLFPRGPFLPDDLAVPITVTDGNRIRLDDGTELRGRLAPAFFTEDARNPGGLDRVDEVNLDGDASLPDLVFEDGRDDDRNDLAVSLRIEDAPVTTAATTPPPGAGLPDLVPAGVDPAG